jgi:hypothetical protein
MDRSVEGVVSVERLIRLRKQGSLDGCMKVYHRLFEEEVAAKEKRRIDMAMQIMGLSPRPGRRISSSSSSPPGMKRAPSSPRTRALSTGRNSLGDQAIASVILDRLLHHSRGINIKGRAGSRGRPSPNSSRTNNKEVKRWFQRHSAGVVHFYAAIMGTFFTRQREAP